jgi:hypothetical protein
VSEYKWLEPSGRQIKVTPDPDKPGHYCFELPATIVERTIIRSLEPFVTEIVREIVLD